MIPSFVKVVYDHESVELLIPKSIFKYFYDLDNKDLMLRNARGYTWDVTIVIRSIEKEQARLTGSWRAFVVDNDIWDDFAVLFVNNEPNILDVTVFDVKGVASSRHVGDNEDNFFDEPSLIVSITKTALERGRIAIPKAFWKEHIVPNPHVKENKATILGPNDKRWVVDVVKGRDGRHFFTGCQEFIEDLLFPLDETIELNLQKFSTSLVFQLCTS